MSLVPGNPNPAFGKNLKETIGASHPQHVAVASALHSAGIMPRKNQTGIAPQHFDNGGGINSVFAPANQIYSVPGINVSVVPNAPSGGAHANSPHAPSPAQQPPGMSPLQGLQLGNDINKMDSAISSGGMAEGGGIDLGEMDPVWSRQMLREAQEPYHGSGLFSGASPGRTDVLNRAVPPGGYVVPADVVSGLGEGSTLAGAAVIDRMFNSDPYGIRAPHSGVRANTPHAPAPFKEGQSYAKGGTTKPVPIVAASGEYLIHPNDIVKKFKAEGDTEEQALKRGHAALDKWVVLERRKIAKTMMKLQGPKK